MAETLVEGGGVKANHPCIVAVGIVAATTLALAGCSADRACFAAEERAYPAVEQFAYDVMADAPDVTYARLSACEDIGKPDATVLAVVDEGTARPVVISYLRDRGFTFTNRVQGRSPDGRFSVKVLRSNFGGSWHVEVRFAEAAT